MIARAPRGRFAWPCLAAATFACAGSLKLTPSDHERVLARHLLDAPDPSRPGPFAVRTLYYGSGTDRRRPEYRDSVTIRTPSVDASKLVDLGSSANERNGYWGFTPEEFPLNGRVWYPEGAGPFPLVLIVHGNHNMKDYSDPGYGYLGELLASRGFVLVSVDMNFLNGSIRNENDARGWMILKHLEAWRGFVADPGNPFHQMADLDRVALIGHSRGGEAVGHAAAFNRLTRYPDDASLAFDFGFGIQSVIAIAPVDGQYLPAGRHVPVENVHYMVFHGSHDGDVTSFHGLRQYQRVAFTDPSRWFFKTAIYVYRANHGQWNTVWGNQDNGPRSGRRLELRGLLDPEEQRQFGKVYMTAFLEATLKDDTRYLPLFRDHRVIGGWLPQTMYITRYQTSDFRPIATFEEDIDVTTGTAAGATIAGDSLATWREQLLDLRSRNRPNTSNSQQNQAVFLGWNNRVAGRGDSAVGTPARYRVTLPDTLAGAWRLDPATTLELLLTATKTVPPPRKPAAADSGRASDRRERARARAPSDGTEEPLDLTVEVSDVTGAHARVPLSRYGPIRRPLEIKVLRRGDASRFDATWELTLQSFSIPLGDFTADNPALALDRLHRVELVFDRSPAGTVVVDHIGFSKLPAAFTAVSASAP